MGFDRRVAQATWTAALVIGGLYALFAVRQTVFIFILGLFLAYLIVPPISFISRLRTPRLPLSISAGVVFAALIGLVTVAGLLAGPTLANQASTLSEQLPKLLQGNTLLDRLPLPGWMLPYKPQVAHFISQYIQSGASMAMPIAKKVGSTALVVAANLVFVVVVPILAFLLIKDGSAIRTSFLAFAARGGHGRMWHRIVDDLDGLLGSYMRALLLLSLATLTAYAIAFTVAGVQFSLVLAVAAAVLEFVPVLGPLAAAVAVVAVALVTGYDHVLGLVAFIAAYRLFQDYILSPFLMSGGVEISPLLVLFGLLAGEEIGGVAGIFLSVPVLAGARIVALRIMEQSDTETGQGSAAA